MAATSFDVHVLIRKGESDAMVGRLMDMAPAFRAVIHEWSEHNKDKFAAGAGMEGIGLDFVPEPHWESLTDRYHNRKEQQGFADHLMVRSGDLARALTNEDGFYQNVGNDVAIFGGPLDPEDMVKVRGNWDQRQSVFLDATDARKIRSIVNGYIGNTEEWQTKWGPEAGAIQKAKTADWMMDYELNMVYEGGGGSL